MFIKKNLYKITNPKKYHEYIIDINIKRKIKWYKSYFEEKIINIQKKIKNQKVLSFLHSGHLGDIVDSLSIIKELSKTHQCKFYIEANKIINVKYNKHPADKAFLTDKMVNMMLPLLKRQNYIDHVDAYSNQKIDIDLNLFHELAMNLGLRSIKWYSHITGVHVNLSIPYLLVDSHKEIKNKVVILRTNRRNNDLINYKFFL